MKYEIRETKINFRIIILKEVSHFRTFQALFPHFSDIMSSLEFVGIHFACFILVHNLPQNLTNRKQGRCVCHVGRAMSI